MKKDRNCGGTSYPVYPTYPGMMMPGMMGPSMPMPMPPTYSYSGSMPTTMMPNSQMSQGISSNTIEQQFNQMQQQINNLERRVTRLESNTSNNTTSFGSNYQMM